MDARRAGGNRLGPCRSPNGDARLDGRLTWEEVRDLDRARTWPSPVGAVEAHGPHLPLGTDVIIAEAMARAGRRTADRAARAPRPWCSHPITSRPRRSRAAFAGTLGVRPTP